MRNGKLVHEREEGKDSEPARVLSACSSLTHAGVKETATKIEPHYLPRLELCIYVYEFTCNTSYVCMIRWDKFALVVSLCLCYDIIHSREPFAGTIH